MSGLKYLSTLSLPLTLIAAFALQGQWVFLPLLYAFGIIPLLELFISPDKSNLSKTEEALIKDDPVYDWMIYLMVAVQYICMLVFLNLIVQEGLLLYERIGLIIAMGLMCGIFGINVGHELGHRKKRNEQWLAKAALLSSMYMHFFIEHNRGHHKHVATPTDPASARYGEWIFSFWIRSIWNGYLSAWKLESNRLKRKEVPIFSLKNEMMRFQLIQITFLLAIFIWKDLAGLLSFLAAAGIGILLLETVNYIEHYGLLRKKNTITQKYERVLPCHSWNSNHVIGRLMLFELSRHSDHHFLASRKYQILRHHEKSPQMPTGYPGMMLLALIPPIWFSLMHSRIRKFQTLMAGSAV